MLKRISLLVVVFLIASCSLKTAQSNWPARLVAMNGFTSDQQAQVMTVLEDLNNQMGSPVIKTDGSGNGYPITFQLVTEDSADANRAGLAIVSSDQCIIQLSTVLFTQERQGDQNPVIKHEMGHAAGLYHIYNPNQIMNPVVQPYGDYTESSWTNFETSMRNSIHSLMSGY